MEAARNVTLTAELFEQVAERAQAEGKTPDEVANEAIGFALREGRWGKLLAYGKRQSTALGLTESDVPRLIAESRHERRGR